jgi:hypothetical protein
MSLEVFCGSRTVSDDAKSGMFMLAGMLGSAIIAAAATLVIGSYENEKTRLTYMLEISKLSSQQEQWGREHSNRGSEIDIKMLELAVGILRSEPIKESKNPIRVWAVETLRLHSKVNLPEEVMTELAGRKLVFIPRIPLGAGSYISDGFANNVYSDNFEGTRK